MNATTTAAPITSDIVSAVVTALDTVGTVRESRIGLGGKLLVTVELAAGECPVVLVPALQALDLGDRHLVAAPYGFGQEDHYLITVR